MNTEHLPQIYTDGSCLKNPGGPGGWACLVEKNNEIWSLVGSNPNTTNNRMELQAVIEALNFIDNKEIVIFTDSQWVIKCATGKWKRKANIDLWSQYDVSSHGKKIHYIWVRGHNGNKYNEIVDKLAREEAKTVKK
jgi:ribonuclease HI